MNVKKLVAMAAVSAALVASILAGCESRDGGSSSSSSMSSSAPSISSSSAPESQSSSGSSSSSASSAPGGSSLVPGEPTPSSEPDNLSSSMPSSAAEPTAAAGSADFSQIGALDGSAVLWGPGHQVDAENRPTAPVGLQEKYKDYNCLFIGDKDQKTIYLTFDQGYENGYTAPILDTLKEKNVPAVFFLTGHYVQDQPQLIERMVQEGHVLGNHTNKHLDTTQAPLEKCQTDLLELNDMVREGFGVECKLFRFPEGKFSEQSLALVDQNGMKSVFWSFAYADWDPDKQMAPSDALEQLTSRLHNGAIYLLHSVSATNAAVLGDFIDAAKAKGYEFAAVPQE